MSTKALKSPGPFGRHLRRLLCVVIALPLLYALAALILGMIPLNRQWRPAPDGIAVWLTTNGVHAGIAMPARTDIVDWSTLFRRSDMGDGRGDYVTVGWGDRTFFLDTPTWADLSASTAINAISGLDGTLMHVEYGSSPEADPTAVRLSLTPEAYVRLVDYVRASVPLGTNGMAKVIPGRHYANDDAFYEAHGRYSLFVTCNQWTRNAMAAAGIRVPAWSPFDKALFWQLRNAHQTETPGS